MRLFRSAKPIAFLILFASILSPALADTVIEGVLTEETNSFGPGVGIGGFESNVGLAVSPNNPVGVDVDFGNLGVESVSVVWKAPPGKVIEFAAPADFNFASFALNFWVGTSLGNNQVSPTPTIEFVDAPGLGLESQASCSLDEDRNSIFVSLNSVLLVGEVSHCREIRVSFEVPASYDRDFDNTVHAFALHGTVSGNANVQDPGQWIRLIDDPAIIAAQQAAEEAAVVAMQIAEIKEEVKTVTKKIRKALKNGNTRLASKLKRKKRKVQRRLRSL